MMRWLKSLFTNPPPENVPQLEMYRDNLDNLPQIREISGYETRTYQPGDEQIWCQIMEDGKVGTWTIEKCREKLTEDVRFKAENLFFITHNDAPVASVCAWRSHEQSNETGEVHMVAALSNHRGKGLGHLLNALVLHRLKELGYQKAHLKTDDWRLAAIKTYLDAGFQPLNTHESHPERWDKIFSELGIES